MGSVVPDPDVEGGKHQLVRDPIGGETDDLVIREIGGEASVLGSVTSQHVHLVGAEEEEEIRHLGGTVVQILGPKHVLCSAPVLPRAR